MGYTYLAWNDVYRVGDQIDTRVNPTQLGGRTRSWRSDAELCE